MTRPAPPVRLERAASAVLAALYVTGAPVAAPEPGDALGSDRLSAAGWAALAVGVAAAALVGGLIGGWLVLTGAVPR